MFFDLSQTEYIDTHSHLQFHAYKNTQVEILNRMIENKIATICVGTDLKEAELAKILAEENENIFYSVGLHPHDNLEELNIAFNNKKEYFEKLKSLADNEKCLAIGECGLDYFYIYKDFESGKISLKELEKIKLKQKEVFISHIELAIELDLPLMLHIRSSEYRENKEDAYLDAIEILLKFKNIKGNFHFFVGSKNILENILKELPDFTVSITAVCTITDEYDEMIKQIPLNKIHIETDSPFVSPKNRRKEAKKNNLQNEPSFVIDVFDKICEIKNIKSVEEKEEFKEILKENFKKMYLK